MVHDKEFWEKELLKNIPQLTGFFKPVAIEDGPTGGSSPPRPTQGAGEAWTAQVDVTREEQTSGAEEEGGAHEH